MGASINFAQYYTTKKVCAINGNTACPRHSFYNLGNLHCDNRTEIKAQLI